MHLLWRRKIASKQGYVLAAKHIIELQRHEGPEEYMFLSLSVLHFLHAQHARPGESPRLSILVQRR